MIAGVRDTTPFSVGEDKRGPAECMSSHPEKPSLRGTRNDGGRAITTEYCRTWRTFPRSLRSISMRVNPGLCEHEVQLDETNAHKAGKSYP
jgi:hypothetical protein